MKVIRHQDEFIQLKDSAAATFVNRIQEEPCSAFGAKDGPALPSYGCDEECAIRENVHPQRLEAASFIIKYFERLEAMRFHGRANA